MPFFVFAEDAGIIGSNLGLDFYSRIDDAWDNLAQWITKRRLNQKWNYGSLGCNAPWLDSEKIDQKVLEELKSGNYSSIMGIATSKQVDIATPGFSLLTQCLVQKYNEIEKDAHRDQNTLEVVGNIWLYTDGDITNSDYDILYDMDRINGIVFKDKDEYAGSKNASSKAIANMLSGKPISSLFPWSGNTTKKVSSNVSGWTPPLNMNIATVASNTNSVAPSIWNWICAPSWTSTTSGNNLFANDPFDDMSTTLAGGWMEDGFVYTPGWSQWRNSWAGTSASSANFGKSEKKIFLTSYLAKEYFVLPSIWKKGIWMFSEVPKNPSNDS